MRACRLSIRSRPARCFTFLLTINLLIALSAVDYLCCVAEENGNAAESWTDTSVGRLSSHGIDAEFTPGSAIQVTIWQEPDLSGKFSIDSRGYVILPLIGSVNVGRFTPESLEGYLKEEYSSYLRNPIIQTLPLIRISVLGYVRNPGSYRVEPGRPLWDVIAMAGGPSDRGDITGMYVSRGAVIKNEDLLNAYEEGVALREIGIQSGDQIVVPLRHGPFPWRLIISLASLGTSAYAIATRN